MLFMRIPFVRVEQPVGGKEPLINRFTNHQSAIATLSITDARFCSVSNIDSGDLLIRHELNVIVHSADFSRVGWAKRSGPITHGALMGPLRLAHPTSWFSLTAQGADSLLRYSVTPDTPFRGDDFSKNFAFLDTLPSPHREKAGVRHAADNAGR